MCHPVVLCWAMLVKDTVLVSLQWAIVTQRLRCSVVAGCRCRVSMERCLGELRTIMTGAAKSGAVVAFPQAAAKGRRVAV